uniref:Sulfite exporter TauE/SafE family protein n=1 Tax=Setaria digitata TaxID=48799 RepID=A0A915Q7V1_9BILA
MIDTQKETNGVATSTIRRTLQQFFRHYFLEGQKYSNEENTTFQQNSSSNGLGSIDILLDKHRKLFGFLIPFTFFQTIYWLLAFRYSFYHYFVEKYVMSIAMVFGALIGGMTTEGGGAVAFPVMTLALNISPTVARDFSLMIQSCGLSAASFTIFFTGILVEWHSIIFSTIGAIFGIVFGLQVIDPLMTATEKKMAFVSVFFSFAIALFILNSEKKRNTFNKIKQFTLLKAFVLIINGFIGGIFTGVAGSGIDIFSFSILTLLFRISEKVATPTSVILMAANSIVGFFWRQFMQNEIQQESWEYFAVCLPVVVIFAPIGSFIASYLHRLVLASFIYILETIALVSALIIIKPHWPLLIFSLGLIIGSLIFYMAISQCGRKLAVQKIAPSEIDKATKNINVASSV